MRGKSHEREDRIRTAVDTILRIGVMKAKRQLMARWQIGERTWTEYVRAAWTIIQEATIADMGGLGGLGSPVASGGETPRARSITAATSSMSSRTPSGPAELTPHSAARLPDASNTGRRLRRAGGCRGWLRPTSAWGVVLGAAHKPHKAWCELRAVDCLRPTVHRDLPRYGTRAPMLAVGDHS